MNQMMVRPFPHKVKTTLIPEQLFKTFQLTSFCLLIGGVAETPCPYKCVSDRYHMPHCYTALEELIYTFGGPWLFGLLLVALLILLALVLSVARMKFVGVDELPGPAPTQHGSQIDHSFPFLESLNEVFLYICLCSLKNFCFTGICCLLSSSMLSRFMDFYLDFRWWKQIEWRNPRAMCIECTLWVLILSVIHGIFPIHHQIK